MYLLCHSPVVSRRQHDHFYTSQRKQLQLDYCVSLKVVNEKHSMPILTARYNQ